MDHYEIDRELLITNIEILDSELPKKIQLTDKI